jgi:hypothetical protein
MKFLLLYINYKFIVHVLIHRLTRMLQTAMEVYGVQGLFKTTCINTLTLLRDNNQSIMV